MKSKNAVGLKEQIKKAKSETEINKLLAEGKTYDEASIQTKSAWKNAAKKRINELTPQPKAEVKPVEVVAETSPTKSSSKKGDKKGKEKYNANKH